MSRNLLFGIVLTVVLTTYSLPAASQAIAESVMLHAGSATAATKAGSGLSSALKQSSKQLAGRVPQPVSRPPQSKASRILLPKNQIVRTVSGSMPQSGAMIVSIQGAAVESCPAKCNSNGLAKPESQKYKSVVTLSSPK
jgi:hypothetical protein